MLVLTRKAGERLLFTVGRHEFSIEVLASSHGRARIGIEAPRQVKVLREELGSLAVAAAAAQFETALPHTVK